MEWSDAENLAIKRSRANLSSKNFNEDMPLSLWKQTIVRRHFRAQFFRLEHSGMTTWFAQTGNGDEALEIASWENERQWYIL